MTRFYAVRRQAAATASPRGRARTDRAPGTCGDRFGRQPPFPGDLSPRVRDDPRPAEHRGAPGVEDPHGQGAREGDLELGGDVPVAVEDELASPQDPAEQVLPEGKLVRAGQPHQRGQPLGEVLHREGKHVVVQHHHRERPRRRLLQRDPDVGDVLAGKLAVAVDEGAVVRRRRVYPDHVEPGDRGDGHAPSPHQAARGGVAHAVVVAGNGGQAPRLEERGEDPLVAGELGRHSTVGDVAGEQHLVDPRRGEHPGQPPRGVVGGLVPPDVEVGEVDQGPQGDVALRHE